MQGEIFENLDQLTDDVLGNEQQDVCEISRRPALGTALGDPSKRQRAPS
jgi:hypothetical protein